MEAHEIAPQAVTTIDDLFAKLDMIHEAAKQWCAEKAEPEMAMILIHRAVELFTDLHLIDDTPEHWATVGEKLEAIREVVRQANLNESFNAG